MITPNGIAIFGIVVSVPIGALISLIVLLPPIRKQAQQSKLVRTTVVLIFSFLAFAVLLGLLTWLNAEDTYTFIFEIGFRKEIDIDEIAGHKKSIVKELWVRKIFPPFLQQSCYTKQAMVCKLTDDIVHAYYEWLYSFEAGSESIEPLNGMEYLKIIAGCLMSALTCGALVGFITRSSSLEKRVVSK